MDPITKALHETWKTIVSEEKIKQDKIKSDTPFYEPMYDMSKPPTDDGGWEIQFDHKKIGPNYKGQDRWVRKPDAPRRPMVLPSLPSSWLPEPKPSPTRVKTPYDARGGDTLQPAKTPFERPLINNNPISPADYGKAKQARLDIINPMNPTRNPGLRLPDDFWSRTPKTSNDVFGDRNVFKSRLNSIPKIYEERDTEGQMAMGELKVLAQKAQELASMMKDDTQLEAWVQSKITKAKDYISSVHDYMNGNPDKID